MGRLGPERHPAGDGLGRDAARAGPQRLPAGQETRRKPQLDLQLALGGGGRSRPQCPQDVRLAKAMRVATRAECNGRRGELRKSPAFGGLRALPAGLSPSPLAGIAGAHRMLHIERTPVWPGFLGHFLKKFLLRGSIADPFEGSIKMKRRLAPRERAGAPKVIDAAPPTISPAQ
jgi:hypothetical protein